MESDLALHLDTVLTRLRQEKDLLDQAIVDLERLDTGRKRPRGRPPGRNGVPRFNRTAAASGDIG